MRRVLSIALLLAVCVSVSAQSVSYWFQNWQRSPDAQSAANYFMYGGTNILLTYSNNHVVINLKGPIPTNMIPNIPGSGGPWSQTGSDVWWLHTPPGQVWIGDGVSTNIQLSVTGDATYQGIVNVQSLYASKNIAANGTFFGDGSGLTNLTLPSQQTQWPYTAITNAPWTTNGGTFTGSFTGNGAGLTNIPLTSINGALLWTNWNNAIWPTGAAGTEMGWTSTGTTIYPN